MSAKPRKLINLLPQEEFASSTFGRILTWVLSSFRIIVIMVDVLVMMAFFSRFWLDARSNDLDDLVKQKQSLISASSDFEDEFKQIQKKLAVFSVVAKSEKGYGDYIKTLTSLLPNSTSLASLSFADNELSLKGVSPDESGIAQFITNLEASESFQDTVLFQVGGEGAGSSLLTFSAKTKIKEGGSK